MERCMSGKQTIITRAPAIPYEEWVKRWEAAFSKKDESKALTKTKEGVECPKRCHKKKAQ
jgi:hypothetical protein